jgi:hypothetical protein
MYGVERKRTDNASLDLVPESWPVSCWHVEPRVGVRWVLSPDAEEAQANPTELNLRQAETPIARPCR